MASYIQEVNNDMSGVLLDENINNNNIMGDCSLTHSSQEVVVVASDDKRGMKKLQMSDEVKGVVETTRRLINNSNNTGSHVSSPRPTEATDAVEAATSA